MQFEAQNPFGPTSTEDITAFEARRKIVFPEDYRQFLLKSNGGRPIPDVFDVPGFEFRGGTVNAFYGLHNGPYSRLEQAIEMYAGRIPADLIPIAAEDCGNIVCIGWKGKRRGKVYFWDHENELDENGRGRTDYENVYIVANSLGEFLDKLKELED